MESIRRWIGLSNASSANNSEDTSRAWRDPATPSDLGEQRELLLARQQQQLQIDQARLASVQQRIQVAVAQGNQQQTRELLVQRNRLQLAVRQQQGKLDNLQSTQKMVATADENLMQARLMRDGASQLDALERDTDAIDLDAVVDRYRDAAVRNHEFSTRLAEPFDVDVMLDVEAGGDALNVDDEVGLLMQQEADRRAAEWEIPSSAPQPRRESPLTQKTQQTQQTQQTQKAHEN